MLVLRNARQETEIWPSLPLEESQATLDTLHPTARGLTTGIIPYGEPAFYAYAYPQPAGYATGQIRPDAAYVDEQLGEFILRYEDVRRSPTPDRDLLDFFESTYDIAVRLADWDRARLEFDPSAAS